MGCGSKDNKIVRDFVVQCYLAWLIRVPLGPPLVPSVLSEVKEFSLVPLGLGKGVRPTEHSQGSHCYGRIPIASIPWLPPYYSVRKKSLSPEITRLTYFSHLWQNPPGQCYQAAGCPWGVEGVLRPGGDRECLPWPLVFSKAPSGSFLFIGCLC